MGTPTTTTRNFTIDTKGSCFMCLKYDPESPPVSLYSYQRLSKYLQLNYKNVYNISFSMASVSVFEDSEVLVFLCNQCSTEANKFVKLHKDLELIRKRVNICVGRIHKLMDDATKDPHLLQEYQERIRLTANPLELIQASIAENLRKETIEKSSKLNPAPTAQSPTTSHTTGMSISRITLPSPSKKQATPIPGLRKISPPTSQSDNSGVSSTSQEKEVPVVDLDSDSEDTAPQEEPDLVISSVTGAAGTIFSTSPNSIDGRVSVNSQPHRRKQNFLTGPSPFVNVGSQQQQSQQRQFGNNSQASTSFSALQNFSSDFEFDLREFGINVSSNQQTPSSSKIVSEDDTWKRFSDGKSQCKHCGKTFDNGNYESLTIHARMHAGVKPISCDHCNQTFRSAGNRRIHTLTYHRKELFSQFRYPAVSNEIFKNAIDAAFQSVKTGQESGRLDRPYNCPHCPKYYRHKIDVEAHMVNVHFNEIGTKLMELQRLGQAGMSTNHHDIEGFNTDKAINVKKVSCEACGLMFRNPSDLTRHLTIGCTKAQSAAQVDSPGSTEKRPTMDTSNSSSTTAGKNYVIRWKCGICSAIFSSQADLKRHKSVKHGANLKITSGDSGVTYSCQYCSKKFKFYHSQRVHMLTLHRYQVFSKYVPAGTPLSDIESGIQRILEASKVSSANNTYLCKFCNRDFAGSVVSILHNHILVGHFQEVIKKLKSAVEEAIAESAQVESTTDSSDGPIKTESASSAAEVVLPD